MNHIAIIDNYDSFTYNLVQLVEQAGAQVTVLRNDRFALPDLAAYDKLVADDYLFDGLPRRLAVGRYHSWVVSHENLPDVLAVTAVSDEGLIMGLCHRTLDVHGIQFHPESVLTPLGERIIQNWINH